MAKDDKFDASKAVDQVKKDKRMMGVVVGAVALLVGMFLPWVTIDLGDEGSLFGSALNRSLNGFDANSFLPVVLLAVAVAAVLNVANQPKRNSYMVALGVSALAFIIVLVDWPNTSDTLGTVSVGVGYYLSLVGSAVMTVGSGLMLKDEMDAGKGSGSNDTKQS